MNEIDIQATWVTALLDVGAKRVELEEAARNAGLRWYGEGKRDDLQDGALYRTAIHAVYKQYERTPDSWTKLLAYLANSTMFAANEKDLRDSLIKIAAMSVAWVEDIDRRATPGYKDGKSG